jgi:hypothetical protein
MDAHSTLVQMLRQLLKEMEIVSSQGSGYYTCVPFARRYNKLREQARRFQDTDAGLLGTFEQIEENDPKDPSDKSKMLLGIRVEISQLITFLECCKGDASQ